MLSRRRVKRDDAGTPDASKRSLSTGGRARKTSGTSSIDTRDGKDGKDKKAKVKSTWKGDLIRVVVHLLFVIALIFGALVFFQWHMMQEIEWEPPKVQSPKMQQYFGASIITKDFDCSILARRCYMGKKKMRACFLSSLMCVSMLRPDMFPTQAKNQFYYINARHVTSEIDIIGKKNEYFATFHDVVKRPFIIDRLRRWDKEFTVPLTNSKGMPRDNQLFFIPWEILDMEEKYQGDLEYVDLNLDEVPDCIQPKANTDYGRRQWIKSMNWTPKADSDFNKQWSSEEHKAHTQFKWQRETTQRTDIFRVDTVPGFAGDFMKKIIDVCIALLDTELSHSIRGLHGPKAIITDDLLLLIYRHVLIHGLKNPFLMMFKEDEWMKEQEGTRFDPDKIVHFDDKEFEEMANLTNVGASISFLFGTNAPGKLTKIPNSFAVTVSEAKANLNGKGFDLNVPVRISNGLSNVEIVSSAQGERAFHSNIITALRVILRMRLHKEVDGQVPDLNDILHIPMVFYSMQEKKMVFDRYDIKSPLRELLCGEVVTHCASPYDQNSINWQERFNGTTAIQYNGRSKLILSRIDTTQDKRNYAVGF